MFWLLLSNNISQYRHKAKLKHIINAQGAYNVYVQVQKMTSSASIHQKMASSASMQSKEHVQSMYNKMKRIKSKEPYVSYPYDAPSPAQLADLRLLKLH